MKVLIACEFSGIVREAFARQGHDAWSCDLLPTEQPGQHIQGDVLDILDDGWDLMIAHPPCTYLSYAATHCWDAPGRAELREIALGFFLKLYNAPIDKICIENPVGHPNTVFRIPDQIVQPYYFGDNVIKRTCLWLRGLPKLYHIPEDTLFEKKTHLPKPEPIYRRRHDGKAIHFSEAKHGGHERSRFFQGIADAMASQWG
ncbi:MAG: DNA cytosine methyltransferase [Candidatus Scalindua sp.]